MSEMTGNPKQIDNLVINVPDDEEDPEGASLLNPASGQMLLTNRVGKRIIELADGTHDVDTIAETVAQEFQGAEKASVLAHAHKFLGEATEKGIVTWTGQA